MLGQAIVFAVVVLALGLFVWGRWRYDLVALACLLVLVVARIVPADEAFLGFGHPAVITVAAVLVASRGLLNSGLVDWIARLLFRVGDSPTVQVCALTFLVTAISGFMNDVGALALLMPVAIQMARKSGRSPSFLLIPLAFGSLLGGLVTMIGTPPNIIISSFRRGVAGERFAMFDFTPVGSLVALAGALLVGLVGWRLIPRREGQASREELFEIREYTTEVRVPEASKAVGLSLGELEEIAGEEVSIVALVRDDRRSPAPSLFERLRAGDSLILESDSDSLRELLGATGLELAGKGDVGEEEMSSDQVALVEAIVKPGSPLLGRTAASLHLRPRYGINLLAVARQGGRLRERLRRVSFRAGDILLLQGPQDEIFETIGNLGCLPLAERGLRLGQPRRAVFAALLFGGAIAAAAMGLTTIEVGFVLAALLMVASRLLSLREAYESIEWPVIVLLAAMLPVGQAMDQTGGAQTIANLLVRLGGELPPAVTLGLLLAATMALSNVMNNAAVAVLMAPIAVRVAEGLNGSPDPFLMAIAVGASCTFLTPIGHQSNALVMGPGGYQFGDYWRLGLPLSLAVLLLAVPLILYFWPLAVHP